MKILRYATVLLLASIPIIAGASPGGKVLFVVSNVTDMGNPEQHDARNNLWEYAPPYHVFLMHGYDVDFVSPKGGAVEFMMDPVGISSYAIKYQDFLGKANATLDPSAVRSKQYVAVFVGGGYGTLFDAASDRTLLRLVGEIYESGGVVGACGHGPGVLASVKLSDGTFLVSGKRVAGFPNSTELEKPWAKQGSLLPFLVENQLRAHGAIVQNKDNLADKEAVVIDQRVVSTMFLPSAALVAEEMVQLMRQGLE